MFVLDLYETARDMWLTIRSRDVMELPEENADLSALHQFLRRVVKEGGMDVTPLEEIVERVLDEDALRAAPIRFGIVTVEQRGLRPRELTLEDIPAGQVRDYLMASAACFPALRARQIDGVKFLDGGYSDNMPTGLAKTMGAEELVCVDLEGVGITRPNLTGLPTTMIRSYWELGDILHFDPDTAKRNMELGYYDTRRAMGYLRGCAYAVSCDAQSCEDAAAFAQKFSQLQRLGVHEHLGLTVLTLGSAADMTAQQVHHQLAAVADAQHRHAPAEDLGVDGGRVLQINAVGAAGEDDALGILGLDDRKIGFIGIDLAVDIIFSDAAGNQLIVLSAKVQHDDSFMLHDVFLHF
mgnify:CR=1 FL=1